MRIASKVDKSQPPAIVRALRKPVQIDLPYPPSANRYWRLAKGHLIVSEEAASYKTAVGLICNVAGITPTANPVAVQIDVRRPAQRRDIDNHCKVLLDSLQGYAYENDGQIIDLHVRMSDNKRNPGVTVIVTERE